MHNISCLNFHQSGQCGDVTEPLSKSKLALLPLAPAVPHYQQQTLWLQGQTSATLTPFHITHTYCPGTELTISHTSKIYTIILPFPYLLSNEQDVRVVTEHTCFHSKHPQRIMVCSSTRDVIGNHSSAHWCAAGRARVVSFCDDNMAVLITVI